MSIIEAGRTNASLEQLGMTENVNVLAVPFIVASAALARISDEAISSLVQAAEKHPLLADLLNISQQPQDWDWVSDLGRVMAGFAIGGAIGAIPGYLLDRRLGSTGIVGITAYAGGVTGLIIASAALSNR